MVSVLTLGIVAAFNFSGPEPAAGWGVLFPAYKQAKTLKWQQVEAFDPYNGGQLTRYTTAEGTRLQFWSNGTVEERQQKTSKKGKWFLNEANDRLMIEFPPSENLPAPKKGAHYPYRFEMRKDTLVLSRQGRHGWVEHRYVKK